jgi:hypothetical protein
VRKNQPFLLDSSYRMGMLMRSLIFLAVFRNGGFYAFPVSDLISDFPHDLRVLRRSQPSGRHWQSHD